MLRKSLTAKIIVTFLFTLLSGYVITALMRTLIDKNRVQDNLLDYENTYQFLFETTNQNQVVIAILTVCVFVYMFSQLIKKPKEYEDASQFGVHGTARWTKTSELVNDKVLSKNNKYKPKNPIRAFKVEKGLILGKVPDKNELLILPKDTKVDNRNVLVVGSSGSGKGQAYVLNNIINNSEETMIVTDPKGELYRFTNEIKRDQGYEVYQIDFTDFKEGGYNPLTYVQDDQDAQHIAKIIAKNSAKDGKEDFFQVEGQRLLTAIIVYCITEYPDANIPDHVFNMFNQIAKNEEFLDNLLVEMEPNHPAYQQLRSVSVSQGKTRASIMASFTQQTGIFAINKVANMTRNSTFNFRDFQKRKSILYVKLPMEDNPFVALTATFFDQLISVFYRMANENNSVLKIPTIFMLDEFANVGTIEKYGSVLSTCRGLGISMNTIVQDFGQLEKSYGKELTRTIISNHDTAIYLRTKDTETAKYFSELAGYTTTRIDTDSTSTQGGLFSSKYSSSKSNQEQFVKRELITTGELTSIDKNISYIFISGFHPFKAEKAWQSNIYDDLLADYSKYKGHLPFKKEKNDVDNKVIPVEEIKDDPSESDEIVDEINQTVETSNTIPIHDLVGEEREENDDFDLDALINNPDYVDAEHQKNEHLDQIEKNKFVIENADELLGVFNESEISEDVTESIEADKEALPM